MPDFDVAAYTNKMVDMFAASMQSRSKLLCSNELMRVIIDHYGERHQISPYDDTHFTVIVKSTPAEPFMGGLFKFMGKNTNFVTPILCR